MNTKEKSALRSNAKKLQPILRIGKSGLTVSVVKEIEKLLEKRNLVKIKLLGSSITNDGKKELINKISLITNSELIDNVGNVFVIYRK